MIEPAFFEVEVDVVWWFDVPCAALLAWADPLLDCPLGPRARTGVEAKVRLITVTRRRSVWKSGARLGPLLGVGGFLVEGASGCIDPSTCHAKSADDLSKRNEKFVI